MTTELNSRAVLEHVSPYKICVMSLIQEYCLVKTTVKNKGQAKRVLFGDHMKPELKRDFCMLALQLTQSPDMEYEGLMSLLEGGKYRLDSGLLDSFKSRLSSLLQENSLCSLFDLFSSVERLIDYTFYDEPLVNKTSKIGIYLRRVYLYFEKMSFDETVKVHKDLQAYAAGRKGSDSLGTGGDSIVPLDSVSRPTMDMDLSGTTLEFTSPPSRLDHSLPISKEEGGRWSKQQVDVFVSEQARLLANQPALALPPPQLQHTIHQILSTSCQHVDAHYLSYLNCVRSKEVLGAVSSLYHFFDRKVYPGGEDDRKALRLAALNLAILHAVFNRKEQALSALNEAIMLAHEANDSITLQYCQTWIHILSKNPAASEQDGMMERCLTKCEELNLGYLLSFTYQAFAQTSKSQPSVLFELMRAGEGWCGYDREASMVQRAGLWTQYGLTDLAALYAQRLLNLAAFSSASVPVALAILVQQFALRGEYEEGMRVVEESERLTGCGPSPEWLVLAEGVLLHSEALHRGSWQQADHAVRLVSLIDDTEADLRKCEVLLAKGDRPGVASLARKVMSDETCTPMAVVRALRLLAKADKASAPLHLARAFTVATANYLRFHRHLVVFDMLDKHVEWGRGVSDTEGCWVLSSCSYAHVCDCLVTYSKSRVLSAHGSPPSSVQREMSCAVGLLDQAQRYATALQDSARLKHISYLQAVLCDSLGLVSDRNRYSFQFRTLDEQFPSYNASL